MTEAGIFKVIEEVLKKREANDEHRHRDKVHDVLRITKADLSVGEIRDILAGAGATISREAISRSMRELIDDDKAEYVGREYRMGNIKMQSVPCYRVNSA